MDGSSPAERAYQDADQARGVTRSVGPGTKMGCVQCPVRGGEGNSVRTTTLQVSACGLMLAGGAESHDNACRYPEAGLGEMFDTPGGIRLDESHHDRPGPLGTTAGQDVLAAGYIGSRRGIEDKAWSLTPPSLHGPTTLDDSPSSLGSSAGSALPAETQCHPERQGGLTEPFLSGPRGPTGTSCSRRCRAPARRGSERV